jgi:hypothetical protein
MKAQALKKREEKERKDSHFLKIKVREGSFMLRSIEKFIIFFHTHTS